MVIQTHCDACYNLPLFLPVPVFLPPSVFLFRSLCLPLSFQLETYLRRSLTAQSVHPSSSDLWSRSSSVSASFRLLSFPAHSTGASTLAPSALPFASTWMRNVISPIGQTSSDWTWNNHHPPLHPSSYVFPPFPPLSPRPSRLPIPSPQFRPLPSVSKISFLKSFF